jgi:spermidine synthase
MKWLFGLFIVSGFCSILYEVIWLRSAMAELGVTTPIVSLTLSSFMVGLGLGSYGAGSIVRKHAQRSDVTFLRLYALAELLIGSSATTVPLQLFWGREILLRFAHGMLFSSWGYYLTAGILISATLVPWCACMGSTFPFAMAAMRQMSRTERMGLFSYLYLANVLGAVVGSTVPLLLIESLGFHRTLLVGASLNVLLATTAFCLTLGGERTRRAGPDENPLVLPLRTSQTEDHRLQWLLFGTGITAMGAEVVWVRIYTPFLGTVVYTFAAILAIYLVGTYLGSARYRRRKSRPDTLNHRIIWLGLGTSVLFSFLTADPRLPLLGILRALLGIAPFAGVAGFITPMIVDRFSAGDIQRAGTAYAINIAGCVLGPVLASFVLLPLLGERFALWFLALPWLIVGLSRRQSPSFSFSGDRSSPAYSITLIVLSIVCAVWAKGYEEQFRSRWLRRDSTATVVATGEGMEKRLLVNGAGMTYLTPVTKMMAHLPLALLSRPPEKGLVVCFGMGTTELAMLSWGIDSTAVELVPSVPLAIAYFHPNAKEVLRTSHAHIVVDDGRAYLERSSELFDVITIDPPPPVAAAGSSLLYSKEFYAIAKRHLPEGGILQGWFPGGDAATTASVARAVSESFRYVRAFRSVEGWGIHFLASMSPIPSRSAAELAARMPPNAALNMMEWGPGSSAAEQFQILLNNELSVSSILQEDAAIPALQDDRPVNEYFLLRRLRDPAFHAKVRKLVSSPWQNSGK